jgi:transposase
MKAYSKDLRRKIVDPIERGMPKAQAARTFGVGISTVKRYASKAQREKSLEPGESPGKRPKIAEGIKNLLMEDLEGRPFVTLRERCELPKTLGASSSILDTALWVTCCETGCKKLAFPLSDPWVKRAT